jgi:hypothetical protein
MGESRSPVTNEVYAHLRMITREFSDDHPKVFLWSSENFLKIIGDFRRQPSDGI